MVSCYALQHPSMAEAAAAQEPCLALCFGADSTTTPGDGKQLPAHVWKGGPVSQMPGTEMAGDNLVPCTFQGGLTLPQRSMKPARELILLRKPSHFSPAIWSVKQGMGNGWVIPKEHQPSSQTYFSNALHFNVQVGIPAKRPFLVTVLLFLELGKGALSDAGDVLVLHRLMWNTWKKCSKCKAKIKYF